MIRLLHPIEMQFAHALLPPFINVVDHRDRLRWISQWARGGSRCRRTSAHGLRRHLYLGETVVLVNRLQGTNVRGNKGLAIGAMSIEVIGGMHAQQSLKCSRVEVVIALNRHLTYTPARSPTPPYR